MGNRKNIGKFNISLLKFIPMYKENTNIVLASSSPRRKQLLKELGLSFSTIRPNIDETLDSFIDGSAAILAEKKAKAVADRFDKNTILIASDTIVTDGSYIFGKPSSKEEARNMLSKLSGNSHFVVSGLCIIDKNNNKCYSDEEKTTVTFKKLTEDDIENYLNTGEPFDKAGAYGIQGFGRLIVKKIDGCFFNVMGLPIKLLDSFLKEIGIDLLKIAGGKNGAK